MKTKPISISQIQPGRPQHESLTAEQEHLAHRLYNTCGCLFYRTFEQWELELLRNPSPVRELELWGIIAATFDRLGTIYPEENQRHLLAQIVLRSMGETPTEYPEITEIYAAVSREIMEQGLA